MFYGAACRSEDDPLAWHVRITIDLAST